MSRPLYHFKRTEIQRVFLSGVFTMLEIFSTINQGVKGLNMLVCLCMLNDPLCQRSVHACLLMCMLVDPWNTLGIKFCKLFKFYNR